MDVAPLDDDEDLSLSPDKTPPASAPPYALRQRITYGSNKREYRVTELRDGELVRLQDVETGNVYCLDERGDLVQDFSYLH